MLSSFSKVNLIRYNQLSVQWVSSGTISFQWSGLSLLAYFRVLSCDPRSNFRDFELRGRPTIGNSSMLLHGSLDICMQLPPGKRYHISSVACTPSAGHRSILIGEPLCRLHFLIHHYVSSPESLYMMMSTPTVLKVWPCVLWTVMAKHGLQGNCRRLSVNGTSFNGSNDVLGGWFCSVSILSL